MLVVIASSNAALGIENFGIRSLRVKSRRPAPAGVCRKSIVSATVRRKICAVPFNATEGERYISSSAVTSGGASPLAARAADGSARHW
jgi:hypothetical protein